MKIVETDFFVLWATEEGRTSPHRVMGFWVFLCPFFVSYVSTSTVLPDARSTLWSVREAPKGASGLPTSWLSGLDHNKGIKTVPMSVMLWHVP